MFWIRTKDCLYDYVQENDLDGEGETDHDDDEFNWSGFIIGSICALESLLLDGEYDQKTVNTCEECFGLL